MAKKATTDDRTEESRVQGFKALVDSAKSNSYLVEDANGEYRYWNELSAEGKIRHLAADAAYYNVPFEPFAQEVCDTLNHLPPAAREEAALRVAFHIEGEQHQIAKLLPKHERLEPYPLLDQLRDTLDDYRRTVAALEAEAMIGRAFKETVAQTVRQQDDSPAAIKDQLFGATLPAPTPEPAPQP